MVVILKLAKRSQSVVVYPVTLVHKQIPEYTSLERMGKNRGGKMYLAFLPVHHLRMISIYLLKTY